MDFSILLDELRPLAPVLFVAITAVVVMLLTAIKRNHTLIATATVVGLNLTLLYMILSWTGYYGTPVFPESASIMGMFTFDSFTMFYQMLILVGALGCCTLSHAYINGYEGQREELYILMLFSVVGAMLMVASSHYVSFFVSLELMSIPVYGMLAYTHQRKQSLESGIKYLVLSATASAILLMGMAYVYAYTGTLSFSQTNDLPTAMLLLEKILQKPLVILGLAMMLFAVAFKLSLAPFHKWTPDVYQGASTPMATFLATVAKVATLGLFLRYLLSSGIIVVPSIKTILIIIAVLSIVMGNLLALKQQNLKRVLAYSSIAHFGYILLAPIAMMYHSLASVTVYILVYVLTTLGAFGVITLMSSPYQQNGDIDHFDDYRGLFWRHPILTAILTVMILSLAGIPLTGGFIAKFLIVKELVATASWFLAIALIVGSGMGLYFYLRTVLNLFKQPLEGRPQRQPMTHWGQYAGGMMVILVTLLVLLLGVYPDPVLTVIHDIEMSSPLHSMLEQMSNQGGQMTGHEMPHDHSHDHSHGH